MRDRFNEIQSGLPDSGSDSVRNAATLSVQATAQGAADLEAGMAPPPESGPMAAFFEEISSIRASIAIIKQLIGEIEDAHMQALVAVSEEQTKEHSQTAEGIMSQITTVSSFLQKKLKDMDAANKAFEAKNRGSSDVRIRAAQHAVVVKKFTDVMTEYNGVQSKFQEKYKQRLKKQYLIVKPDATAAEIESATTGENQAIFAQQMLPGAQYLEARKALEDIQDQRRDIMLIEKSLLELQQLFVDMSVLVAQQGEMLNMVDKHVQNALEYTTKGVEELREAVKTQRNTRKRMCCLCFCLIVLAVLLGLGLGVGIHR